MNCDRCYAVKRRRGVEIQAEGYTTGHVLASYVHAHWASNPEAAQGFVRACAAFGPATAGRGDA
jgi:cobyrinic acid a,c-diamide synthase